MGLAASQARLLSLTARIHDVEYQAQMIQNAKLKLALQEDEVYKRYNEALDAQTLTYKVGDKTIAANFDNLFGTGSIKNGLNSSYALRDKNGTLIVPDEIYDAYSSLCNGKGCVDPYFFAMSMIGGMDASGLSAAESQFISGNEETVSKALGDSYKSREALLTDIADLCGTDILSLPMDNALSTDSNVESIKQAYANRDDIDQEKLSELLDSYSNADKTYKHNFYKKFGEQVLQGTEGNGNATLDYDEYNYYLKYAKLIEYEFGIEYVSKASEGGSAFSTDSELLNNMLMNGYLWIDIVNMDNKTGDVNPDRTSASTDTNISFVNKSSVDNTTLKKAEAEYEQAMKRIDRQDKKYDLELNRLETERSALTTEYDSVKKVISDNIERTFGIFS